MAPDQCRRFSPVSTRRPMVLSRATRCAQVRRERLAQSYPASARSAGSVTMPPPGTSPNRPTPARCCPGCGKRNAPAAVLADQTSCCSLNNRQVIRQFDHRRSRPEFVSDSGGRLNARLGRKPAAVCNGFPASRDVLPESGCDWPCKNWIVCIRPKRRIVRPSISGDRSDRWQTWLSQRSSMCLGCARTSSIASGFWTC